MRTLITLSFALVIAIGVAEARPEAAQHDMSYGAHDNSIMQFGRLNNDDFPENLPEGHVCMDKVVQVEETIYDEEMRCNHVTTQSCHQKYETVFKPAQYQKCRDTFKKSCFYEYKKVPQQHNVEICNDNLKRDCENKDGPEVCSIEYVTVCETETSEPAVLDDVPNCEIEQTEVCNVNAGGVQVCRTVPQQKCSISQQENRKLSRSTDCKSVPREVCGPEACPIVKGDRICRNEVKTVVQEVPEESCQMAPRKDCSMETQIIPSLEAVEECVDVPKEICSMVQVNPRVERNPVVKKWCGPAELVGSGGEEVDENGIVIGTLENPIPLNPSINRAQQQQRVQQTKTKKNRNRPGPNKIDAAKLANLKKDFPGLAEAIGGLFFEGKARVGGGVNKKTMGSVPRGKSRMTRF